MYLASNFFISVAKDMELKNHATEVPIKETPAIVALYPIID